MARESPKERLFFALWPDEAVREGIRSQLPPMPKPARPVAPANWHVTLAFLGETDPERRAAYVQAARGVSGTPFDLALDRFGYFFRPRVLWIGATTLPDSLSRLHGELNAALAAHGYEPDRRPFRAHVTLARKMPPPGDLPDPGPVGWRVPEFCLVRSQLGRGGARYAVVERFPLATF